MSRVREVALPLESVSPVVRPDGAHSAPRGLGSTQRSRRRGGLHGRRWVTFLRDWLPLVGLLIAYELMRDLVPLAGVAPRDLVGVERWVSGGGEATLALQTAFYHSAWIGFQDCLATVVYFTHFVLPAAVGIYLWWGERRSYGAFAATLLVASFLAFLTYIALPTLPPWLGHPDQVHKVIDETILKLRVPDWLVAVYSNRDYNVEAAFPSLHSAFPLIATVQVWRRSRRWGLALAGWTALVWLSVVYLGEHYVIDVLGGIAYAALALILVAGWERLREAPRARSVAS